MVLQSKSNPENEDIKKWISIKKNVCIELGGTHRKSNQSVWASDIKQKLENIHCKEEKFQF